MLPKCGCLYGLAELIYKPLPACSKQLKFDLLPENWSGRSEDAEGPGLAPFSIAESFRASLSS